VQRVLSYALGFFGATWLSYVVLKLLASSVKSQAEGGIHGLGGLIAYLVFGLVKIVLILVLTIPSLIWVALFEDRETTGVIFMACLGGAWLGLEGLQQVSLSHASKQVTSSIRSTRGAMRSGIGKIAKAAKDVYYTVMEILLRPKPPGTNSKEREGIGKGFFRYYTRASHNTTNQRRHHMTENAKHINVKVTDDGESTVFEAAVHKFQASAKGILPKIPELPTHSSDYEGWFSQTKKIIAMRKQTAAADQQLELVKSFTDLYAEYYHLSDVLIKIQKNKTEMEKEKQRSELVNLQMDVERMELEAKRSEHELAIARNKAEIEKLAKPAEQAPVSRIQQKEEELKEAQIDAQLQKLKTPPSPTPTPAERLERELTGFKDLEAWKSSWPADESEAMKQARLRIYKEKKGRIMNEA